MMLVLSGVPFSASQFISDCLISFLWHSFCIACISGSYQIKIFYVFSLIVYVILLASISGEQNWAGRVSVSVFTPVAALSVCLYKAIAYLRGHMFSPAWSSLFCFTFMFILRDLFCLLGWALAMWAWQVLGWRKRAILLPQSPEQYMGIVTPAYETLVGAQAAGLSIWWLLFLHWGTFVFLKRSQGWLWVSVSVGAQFCPSDLFVYLLL